MVTLSYQTIVVIAFAVAIAFLVTVIDSRLEVERARRWVVMAAMVPATESGIGMGCAALFILLLAFAVLALVFIQG